MLMLGFSGSTLDDTIRTDLATRNLGGVILMGGNCLSPQQIRQLTASINTVATTPPFIATDQEGGLVARLNLNNGYAKTYTEYQLGSYFASLDSTSAQATRMAGWMSDAGMSVDLAPVVDVDVNPSSPAIGALGRSFSSNPAVVAAHAQRFLDAFHERKLITCVKHFPGHGSAGTDSHLTLPDITNTWADSELLPYRTLLASKSLDMVMVGHLFNAHRDSVYPSSLSKNTVTGLLRDSIGYSGVVISDDFYNMKAITDNFGFGQTAILAVNAGVDILLFVSDIKNGMSLCRQLIDTIETGVHNGAIAEARIDEAYNRILELKRAYFITAIAAARGSGTNPGGSPVVSNYPNPFNPSTTVRYILQGTAYVTVRVYDVLGREIETLSEGFVEAGVHAVTWNAAGHASGVYFCKVTAKNEGPSGGRLSSTVHPLVLVR